MALIQISPTVMINPEKVEVLKYIPTPNGTDLFVILNGTPYQVTEEPQKVISEIMSANKTEQYFGG